MKKMKLFKKLLYGSLCSLVIGAGISGLSTTVWAEDETTTEDSPTFEYTIPQSVKIGYEMDGCEYMYGSGLPLNRIVGYESNLYEFAYYYHQGGEIYLSTSDDGAYHMNILTHVFFKPGKAYIQPCYGEELVYGPKTEDIGEPYIITIEEPIIVHNMPESVDLGATHTLTTQLTNTELVNKKLSDFPYVEKGEFYSDYYESENTHEIVYRPVIEVIEGANLVSRANQDYTNTLNSSEDITFTGEGTVKFKITYEQLNTIPCCIERCENKEDFFYNPEKIITVNVVDPSEPIIITDNTKEVQIEAEKTVVPEGTIVIADKITDGDKLDVVTESLKEVTDKFCAFDISLENNNVKIQPNGKVKVTISIPTGYNKNKLVVYYINDNGAKEKLTSTINNDKISFETEHFSTYVIAESTLNGIDENPDAGTNSIPWILPACIGGIALIGGSVSLIVLKMHRK